MVTVELPPSSEPRPTVFATIRARIVSGLLAALPILVTVWIITWLYRVLSEYILTPVAKQVGDWVQEMRHMPDLATLPWWWEYFAAPLIVVILILGSLYALGLFVRTRLYGTINRMLEHVPIVATIYQGVRGVLDTVSQRRQARPSSRVVLVEFPHPGMRSLGLVTNAIRDSQTKKTILCVCLLTGVMPPTGFTLFIPEENVIDLGWTVNQMVQAILSGGLTVPPWIRYDRTPSGEQRPE